MKKLTSLLLLCLWTTFSYAQFWNPDTTFHENFEIPGGSDSMVSSQLVLPFVNDWNLNTRLHSQGIRCDSCQVKAGKTVTLTSIPFSTAGYDSVYLYFDHICKIDFLDLAKVEYSLNGGITWTALTAAEYLNAGAFNGTFGPYMYPTVWLAANNSAIPNNSWWETERFNLTHFCHNRDHVMIRFVLTDAGSAGANNAKGWYIDKVFVKNWVAPHMPPVIFPVMIPSGIVDNLGPFEVKAIVRDAEGLGSVRVIYSIDNSVPDTIPMSLIMADTFSAFLPIVTDSSFVSYKIEATDTTSLLMRTTYPSSGWKEFYVKTGSTLPYIDSFDLHNLWTAINYNNTKWELGLPNYGATNSTHSGNDAWDINLTNPYVSSSYAVLESPRFYLNQAMNVKLSAWLNYQTETSQDGTSLEYSLNDTVWQPLGSINNPGAQNWFNSTITPIITRQGWSGQSNGWIRSSCNLSFLNNLSTHIRFRYVFTSSALNNLDGFSMDDFSLQNPTNHEASLDAVLSPVAGCNLGFEPVKIRVNNVGLDPITVCTLSYTVNNSPPVVETFTGNIIPGASALYIFTTLANLSQSSSGQVYTIKTWVTLAGDPDHTDDTLTVVINPIVIPPPIVSSILMPTGNFANLIAMSALPVSWYDQAAGGNLLGQGSVFTTPELSSQTVYYCEAVQGGCSSIRVPDTVFMWSVLPWDAGMFRFLMPLNNMNLSDSEDIKVKVRNYGLNTIQSITLKYKINNGAVVSELFNCNIPSGDSLMFTFSQKADLHLPGSYHFDLWTSLFGDGYYQNDTIHQVANNINPYPFSGALATENADIGSFNLGPLSNGVISNPTNNPNANHTYSDFTQSVPAVKLSRGLTYPVCVSSMFSGSAFACSTKVFIDWNADGVYDTATETAFEAGPSKFIFFGTITIPMNAHIKYLHMRVVLIQGVALNAVLPSGTYQYGETEDYLIYIYPNFPQDASVSEIIEPASTAILNTLVNVKLKIKNTGSTPLYEIPLAVSFDLAQDCNYVWQGLLEPDSSAIADWQLGVFNSQNYNFWAFTKLPGDHNGSNDTLHKQVTVVGIDNLASLEPTMVVSPNPCNTQMKIGLKIQANLNCELYLQNILGQTFEKQVFKSGTTDNVFVVNTSNLPEGIYLVMVKSANRSIVKKVSVFH